MRGLGCGHREAVSVSDEVCGNGNGQGFSTAVNPYQLVSTEELLSESRAHLPLTPFPCSAGFFHATGKELGAQSSESLMKKLNW